MCRVKAEPLEFRREKVSLKSLKAASDIHAFETDISFIWNIRQPNRR